MWRHLLFLNASEFDYLSCDPTTTMIFVNKTQEKLLSLHTARDVGTEIP